jgi:hypothetical protein
MEGADLGRSISGHGEDRQGDRDRPLVSAAFQLRTKPDRGDADDISTSDKPAGSLNGTVDADPAQKPEVQRARGFRAMFRQV